MKTHTYHITMEWKGNLGKGTENYDAYKRDHLISAPNKQIIIPGSSDAAFKGDAARYNPEELLVSTISSCHMLWYLHLCAVNGVNVMSYIDEAEGVMEEFENGSGKFKEVTLRPKIQIEEYEKMQVVASDLHHKAHNMCFIANSVNFEIKVEPFIAIDM